jgi:hypothetical protein
MKTRMVQWALRIGTTALVLAAATDAASVGPAAAPPLQLLPDPRPWTEKVTPEVMTLAVSSTSDLDVLVKYREPEGVRALSVSAQAAPERLQWIADTSDGIEHDWTAGGVRVLDRYSHVASVHMTVPVEALPALAADTRVEAIVLNRKVHKLDATGDSYIHVSAVQPPDTGAGVGIALMDSGVDWTHPELTPLGTKTIALFDAYHSSGTSAYAMDDNGHGTEVAGIAAALGARSSAIGVAPAATIVSVKILDNTGSGTESIIIQGINAVLSSVGAGNPYNIRAANFSLGGYFTGNGSGSNAVPDQPCDSQDPVLASSFQQLTNANVIPVVASGNGGCTNGVAWPACISTSLAVGSVYQQSFQSVSYTDTLQCGATGTKGCTDNSPYVGTVACYVDSGAKLDVWAPTCPAGEPLKGGGYDTTYFCGSSASAAYASGLVALVAQASPTTSAASARLAIRNNGRSITDSRNGITRNLILADQAIASLSCSAPSTPSSVGVNQTSACSGQQVVLTWSSVTGATTYTVQVGSDSAFSNPTTAVTTSPTYTFSSTQTSAGTFYFRVRANSSCGASSWSSTVQVTYAPQCQSAYAYTYFLSGIARIPGVAPAYWYSDVSILNATSTSTSVQIAFYGLSSSPSPYTGTLAGGQQLTFSDVLASLFGITQDKGMIVVGSNVPLQTISRTYSLVTNGTTAETFGQSYVGMPATQALTTAATGWFPALRSDGAFRTNLEFVNTSSVPTDVLVSFFTAGGAAIGTTTTTVPALSWTQIVRALPAGQASAYAKVQVLAGGAQILGSASVIDGTSTDPTTIPMWVQ